jgi:hypothetical protein
MQIEREKAGAEAPAFFFATIARAEVMQIETGAACGKARVRLFPERQGRAQHASGLQPVRICKPCHTKDGFVTVPASFR